MVRSSPNTLLMDLSGGRSLLANELLGQVKSPPDKPSPDFLKTLGSDPAVGDRLELFRDMYSSQVKLGA